MRKNLHALLAALLLGCGGGGGTDPDAVTDAVTDAATDTSSEPDVPGDTVTDAPGDATVDGPADCSIFPPDNMWNTPVDTADVHTLSDTYIGSIGGDTELHPDFGAFWGEIPIGIPYNVVPGDQPLVPVSFYYADESDEGPYPVPPDALIEGGPDGDGDRHVLVIQSGTCILYEMFDAWPQTDGSWEAGSGAIWHLDLNEVRPGGWTSADAAGLAIFPGLIRWEEVYEDGVIDHAIRVTMSDLQRAYILPATHSDGTCGSDPDCPPMGLRLRLRDTFDETAFAEPLQVILRAMKRHGLVIADTGSDMFIGGTHDPRWDDDVLHDLHSVHASDFEAVYTGDPIPY
ncbi:MAG: hypothetical protein JRG91_11115 [Deltaproteobacteria bacterium]|nr:hypothetical protein [Deltaproteobacteria bacterium]